MKTIFLLTVLLLLTTYTSSKITQSKIPKSIMKKDSFHPLTKFVMGAGQGSYSLRLWNASPQEKKGSITTVLSIYTYEAWLKQQNVASCIDKVKLSTQNQVLSLPLDGKEVSLTTIPLGQEYGTQVWYFALTSCGDSYANIMLQGNRINYELTVWNSDGSHISEEENGVTTVLWIALIPIGLFFFVNSLKLIQFYSEQKAMDYPLVMLSFALVLEFLSLVTELLHLYVYSINGQGFFLFDWAHAVFSNFGQFMISVLFILMATGWTVKSLTSKDEELFAITGMLAAIAIIINTIMGKISVSDIDSYHDYENITGAISLFIKFGLYTMFGYQLMKNYDSSEGKLKRHYLKLGVFGSIYLLSFPVAVILADFFLPPYMRHKATTYITIIAQSATLLAYASLLSAKEGEYYPIVYKNRTLLPMAKMR